MDRYTEDLHKGEVSFVDFVLCCARGLMELSSMRDEPKGAPLPEKFDPPSLDRLTELRACLAEMEKWDDATASSQAEEYFRKIIQCYKEEEDKKKVLRQRYEDMLGRVRAWNQATINRPLKDFMIDRLETAIKNDCDYIPERPQEISGPYYKALKIRATKSLIDHLQKNYEKEVAWAQHKTDWVQALRESLGL
jgi:hypothetical protein